MADFIFDTETEMKLDVHPEELTKIILDPVLLHNWGSRVFMRSEVLNYGDRTGLGMSSRVHAKGWLPHSFLFIATIVDLEPHKWMTIHVTGDFEAIADLAVTPLGEETCQVNVRWRANINHPQLRYLVRILHPVFVLNHRWAVRSLGKMLQKEINRRRAGGNYIEEETPTFTNLFGFLHTINGKRAKTLGWDKFDDIDGRKSDEL